ncbi:MAG: 1-acyl-sn-glycerol-3-phosphate acyltransferase [Vicinamibacteria bacterium]|nr:1-acyl-sn-glycerol-3-phosphate acyltransferase [Vicinamibacteria bacterium]
MLVWLGGLLLPSILGLAVVTRWTRPATRLSWVSRWARVGSAGAMTLLRLGGARSQSRGAVRTDAPGLVVMNHQSVLDVLVLILMTGPLVPAFVARERYTRTPVIGTGLRLADCPIVDPQRDRAGAVDGLRAAMDRERTFAIFPEGHRSPDGSLQPFRTAGLLAMLGARRVPVYLVATDGFQSARTLLDLAFGLGAVDGRTELLGRFDPPAAAEELPRFVDRLQAELEAGLQRLRARA